MTSLANIPKCLNRLGSLSLSLSIIRIWVQGCRVDLGFNPKTLNIPYSPKLAIFDIATKYRCNGLHNYTITQLLVSAAFSCKKYYIHKYSRHCRKYHHYEEYEKDGSYPYSAGYRYLYM
jgi:hypothetical protein